MNTEEIVIQSLKEIYQQMGIAEEVSPETIIYGSETGINSLSLLLLIVNIEGAVLAKFNKFITLTYDRSENIENSPFYSVANLSRHIDQLLQQA